jgi:hypothetical protein
MEKGVFDLSKGLSSCAQNRANRGATTLGKIGVAAENRRDGKVVITTMKLSDFGAAARANELLADNPWKGRIRKASNM